MFTFVSGQSPLAPPLQDHQHSRTATSIWSFQGYPRACQQGTVGTGGTRDLAPDVISAIGCNRRYVVIRKPFYRALAVVVSAITGASLLAQVPEAAAAAHLI